MDLTLPLTAWGEAMMLSLMLQSRQQASRYQPLLTILPFLGLSGPRLAVQGYGRNGSPPTPWILLQWFAWIGAASSPRWSDLPTGEVPAATVVAGVVKGGEQQLPTIETGGNALPPALLMPLPRLSEPFRQDLPWSHGGHGRSQPVVPAAADAAGEVSPLPTRIPNEPAARSERAVEPLVWGQPLREGASGPAPARRPPGQPRSDGPATHDARPARKSIAEQSNTPAGVPAQPALALEQRAFPALNPALVGLLGTASGRYVGPHQEMAGKRPLASSSLAEPRFSQPEASWHQRATTGSSRSVPVFGQEIVPAAPWSMAGNTGTVSLSTLPMAQTAPERSGSGLEPKSNTPSPVQALPFIADTLRHLVKREVTAEVKRQRAGAAEQTNQTKEPPMPAAPPLPDDDVMRQMMVRMRDLAQEERFRMGRM